MRKQESRVLMLSDQARSDANPILLIDENDVTAGHAASIGQVDPEDMYYLMSRGLGQGDCRTFGCSWVPLDLLSLRFQSRKFVMK